MGLIFAHQRIVLLQHSEGRLLDFPLDNLIDRTGKVFPIRVIVSRILGILDGDHQHFQISVAVQILQKSRGDSQRIVPAVALAVHPSLLGIQICLSLLGNQDILKVSGKKFLRLLALLLGLLLLLILTSCVLKAARILLFLFLFHSLDLLFNPVHRLLSLGIGVFCGLLQHLPGLAVALLLHVDHGQPHIGSHSLLIDLDGLLEADLRVFIIQLRQIFFSQRQLLLIPAQA